MEQNFPTFRGLLRGAICTRTQAQFANDSGISAEHLNRMLNADQIHRPTKQTLHKIAAVAKNGITFDMLKDALDKEDPNFRPGSGSDEDRAERLEQARDDFRPDFRESARSTMESLRKAMAARPFPLIVPSVNDYVSDVVAMAKAGNPDGLDVAYDILAVRPYMGHDHTYAKSWTTVVLTMAGPRETAESEMVMFFTEVPGPDGKSWCTVQYASTAVADIMDVWGMPAPALAAHADEDEDRAFENALCDDFYLDFQPAQYFRERFVDTTAADPRDKFINTLLGVETRFSLTVDGFGFWLDSVPPRYMEFLRNHMDTILAQYAGQPEKYDGMRADLKAAIEADDVDAVRTFFSDSDYADDLTYDDAGLGTPIAVVMQAKTGFPFHYRRAAEDMDEFTGLSRDDCVILDNEDAIDGNIDREPILMATCQYVRELGLKTFGDILFTGVGTLFRKPKTYTVKDGPETEDHGPRDERPGHDYSVALTPETLPAETGLYAVELKDGRHIRCVYLAQNHAWVMCHKEWTHMISAYDPEPIPVREKDE